MLRLLYLMVTVRTVCCPLWTPAGSPSRALSRLGLTRARRPAATRDRAAPCDTPPCHRPRRAARRQRTRPTARRRRMLASLPARCICTALLASIHALAVDLGHERAVVLAVPVVIHGRVVRHRALLSPRCSAPGLPPTAGQEQSSEERGERDG